MESVRLSGRVLLLTLAVYGVLVSTHLGEFWPFSIYPMFSRGGIPWSRAVVHDVSQETGAIPWRPLDQSELPGEPYPLLEHGVDPIDLANFVSKTSIWSEERIAGLRKLLGPAELSSRTLLVMRVNGRSSEDDSVMVEFVPYVLLSNEESVLNETLPRSSDPGR